MVRYTYNTSISEKSLRRKRHLEINGVLVGKRKMNREEKMNL